MKEKISKSSDVAKATSSQSRQQIEESIEQTHTPVAMRQQITEEVMIRKIWQNKEIYGVTIDCIDLAISKTAGLLEKVHKKKIKAIFDDILDNEMVGDITTYYIKNDGSENKYVYKDKPKGRVSIRKIKKLKKKWLDDVGEQSEPTSVL